MKLGIITFEQFWGKKDIGSSRIRAEWICKYFGDEAEHFDYNGKMETSLIGQKYDVIIFQKVYWIEYAELIRKEYPETIMILDLCDADFLHWGHRVRQMVDLMDAVTTSTVELAKYVVKMTDKPVWCIPDRLDFDYFNLQPKVHKGDAKIAAWYGYSENFPMLDAAVGALIRNKFTELIVIASRRSPYQLPPHAKDKITLTNYPWTLETVNQDLLKADVVLNPQTKTGKWRFKSNNKTIAAWALGLPVAHNEDELVRLIPEENRKKEAEVKLKEVKEKYNIKRSVESYRLLIQEIKNERN